MEERVWWTRLRWRLRGATMWPAFLLAVVVDALLLRALPIAGDTAPDVFAAGLLAFFFNLVVVAVGAPLAGRLWRGRRPGLPKVIADDRAGTALIAAVARAFVLDRAPAAFRVNVARMDTWTQGPGLYRTCVPGPDARRSYCVFVDTRHDPPLVVRDRDQSPNSVLAGPDNPGRLVR